MEVIKLPNNGICEWAGMEDYQLLSPSSTISAILTYIGEPPHGDSYHSLSINGKKFPGYAWGCLFAFSSDSRFLVCSWMEKLIERKTVVIDCIEEKYFILPTYIYMFSVEWPHVSGVGSQWDSLGYTFTGDENWLNY
ncbi:Uncharacterised protein [Vibrio cholerae]|nr:hypothetical protein [Vibrio cholerae]EIX4876183.1 hypothetical protein [Vibrio vulnificus]KEH04149.1 hypothetical protein M234_10040 [Vibrio cholerae 2012EL-1759]OFJ37578.1 hypothetical protein BFX33_18220 [Vibrio cholerae V52]PAR33991.1 hypothetical protein CGT97_18350 [Vibrio metoecus]QUY01112.1 hypothetical protein GTH07_15295 [Vibrio cholerae O37]RBM72747.1 hypothetical protein DLR68_17545 [Vibrio paracholerae]